MSNNGDSDASAAKSSQLLKPEIGAKAAKAAAKGQPVSLSKVQTAFNTNAVPSDDGRSELDLTSLPPLEGYEFRGLLFDEVDPLDLHVQHDGQEVKLMTYRWKP
mmetsp:Transcript_11543/g.14538  ORF Transcript_11543/g.14538 Transcript_11543/m.14538 type:complete len:104 (+) Transcript_11543:161-472(+)